MRVEPCDAPGSGPTPAEVAEMLLEYVNPEGIAAIIADVQERSQQQDDAQMEFWLAVIALLD